MNKRVLEAIKELTREYGRVDFSISKVAETCNLSEVTLYNYDNTTGILVDLNDSGYIILSNYGKNPSVCLDSETLC